MFGVSCLPARRAGRAELGLCRARAVVMYRLVRLGPLRPLVPPRSAPLLAAAAPRVLCCGPRLAWAGLSPPLPLVTLRSAAGSSAKVGERGGGSAGTRSPEVLPCVRGQRGPGPPLGGDVSGRSGS